MEKNKISNIKFKKKSWENLSKEGSFKCLILRKFNYLFKSAKNHKSDDQQVSRSKNITSTNPYSKMDQGKLLRH